MDERLIQLTGLDMAIIGAYIATLFGIGILLRGRIHTNEDYAVAGRQLRSPWIALSAFASWVGLSGTFGTPENVYRFGLSGCWWFQAWLPGILLMAFFLAGRLRRRMHVTVPELILSRSSPCAAVIASLVTSWNYLAWTAVQIFALSTIFSTFTNVNPTTGAVIAFAVMVIYTFLGGLRVIVVTDVIQAIIIFGLLGIAAPFFAMYKGYSWTSVMEETREIPHFYTLFKGAGTKTIVVWFLSLLPAAFIDPGGLQRVFAAKSPESARRGLYGSALLYFCFGLSLTFLGLVARAALPGIEAQEAMPALMAHLLPSGLTGLVVAAFLAVAMSTGDTALLVVATTLQRDVYARWRPDIGERERLAVSRILVLLLGIAALLIALTSKSVVTILLLGFSVYVPGLLLPVMAASFDWRLPAWSMLWTIVAGAASSGIWVLVKEPFVPAIVLGLVASAVPFVLGLLVMRRTKGRP